MRALFVVNARSGANRRRDVAALIRSACKWDNYEVVACERKEDLDGIIAEAQRTETEAVFAVGGDGTVHEIAKRLIGTSIALGVIPTGSGNGFARHLGIPCDSRAALAACQDRRVVDIDTGEVNGLPFVAVMGIGFDAWIAHEFAKHPERGLLTYARAALRGLRSYRAADCEVEHRGRTVMHPAYVLTVANVSQYGNGARIAPMASVTDGRLDLVIVRDGSIARAPLLAARLFAGAIHRSAAVTSERIEEVTIRRPAAGPAHVDGEPILLPAELHVRVRPRSLRVLVPKESGRL